MCPWGVRTVFRQSLLMVAFCAASCTALCSAQSESPVGEGGAGGSEPTVVLSDGNGRVPARQASRVVQESTDPLVQLVWDTRETTRRRLLSTEDHTPWQIMHGLLGLRQDLLLSHNGQVVNALDWIKTGPKFRNEPWFQKTAHGGRAHPYSQPYWFEGHINQFLAMLASCNLPLDTSFGTPSGPITMQDMLKNAQMTVNSREEVTWTLWALCTYLPPDARWVNAAGEEWSIERLVQLETAKPVGGPTSPCGGTHGLFALARARNAYLRSGKPLRGVWFAADQKVKKYIEVAKVYRNSDGSLSSGFFKTREYKQDFDKRMASEGHLLEFLMMSVSQQELKSDWVRRAITATCNDLNANQNQHVSCSPLFHAANALSIYLDRVAQEAAPRVAMKPDDNAGRGSGKGGQVRPQTQTSRPRPPKAEGANGIAPPAPPAAGNLQIPPPAISPKFAGEGLSQPAPAPNGSARYPVPPGNPQRPSTPATSPGSVTPGGPGRPTPPTTTPPAPITNPRGVPVKSVSTSKSRPMLQPQLPAAAAEKEKTPATPPQVPAVPQVQPAPKTPPAPNASPLPKMPEVPPVPQLSPTPPKQPTSPGPATTAKPASPAGSQPPAAGTVEPRKQAVRSSGPVSKTSAPGDSEVMLLNDFLGGGPAEPTPSPRPSEKREAVKTPPVAPQKRPVKQDSDGR